MNELPLPFVNDLKRLGNVLQNDNSMTIDCNKKRAIFISKMYSLNQEFHFNSPEMEFKEFEPQFKSAKTWLKLSAAA